MLTHTTFSFVFSPISKVNSTSELQKNLQNYCLFPLPGKYSFLKINMIENPAVKNPKDFEYQSYISVNWAISFNNSINSEVVCTSLWVYNTVLWTHSTLTEFDLRSGACHLQISSPTFPSIFFRFVVSECSSFDLLLSYLLMSALKSEMHLTIPLPGTRIQATKASHKHTFLSPYNEAINRKIKSFCELQKQFQWRLCKGYIKFNRKYTQITK